VLLLLTLWPVAAYPMRLFEPEGANAQAVTLGAVVALPVVQAQAALAVYAIALVQLGGCLGGLAKAGNRDPLNALVLTATDTQSHPTLTGLRRSAISVSGKESVKGNVK
jgi:hypothetical protein